MEKGNRRIIQMSNQMIEPKTCIQTIHGTGPWKQHVCSTVWMVWGSEIHLDSLSGSVKHVDELM